MGHSEGITRLLLQWNAGDAQALEELTALVYDELRRLAAGYLRSQPSDHTLQATALVHEAYLQLLDMQHIEWQSRAHFIGIAARAMRYILIDYARQQSARKRGGGLVALSLSRAERAVQMQDVNLVALGDALQEFEKKYPRQARVVELHFFGGLKVEEIPAILGADEVAVSQRTVERDLRFARAWLLAAIKEK
ncbi:MAG TPA: sigma-70 family RNA polymerase sigma factor [Blastocatellia bacterium]|nr:sigma-70 family RNA polymerase sigma factor [Blastocatellia bacterium]